MGDAMHTPGPWVVGKLLPFTVFKSVVEDDDDGGVVCDCQSVDDARLIAAAPELLEALRGAIGALEFSRDYHADLGNKEQAFAQDKLDAALAVLAKIGGGA